MGGLNQRIPVQEGAGGGVIVGGQGDDGVSLDSVHDVDCADVYLMFVECSADAGEGSGFVGEMEDYGVGGYGAYAVVEHGMKGRVIIVSPEGNHTQFANCTPINVFNVDVRVTEHLGQAT